MSQSSQACGRFGGRGRGSDSISGRGGERDAASVDDTTCLKLVEKSHDDEDNFVFDIPIGWTVVTYLSEL